MIDEGEEGEEEEEEEEEEETGEGVGEEESEEDEEAWVAAAEERRLAADALRQAAEDENARVLEEAVGSPEAVSKLMAEVAEAKRAALERERARETARSLGRSLVNVEPWEREWSQESHSGIDSEDEGDEDTSIEILASYGASSPARASGSARVAVQLLRPGQEELDISDALTAASNVRTRMIGIQPVPFDVTFALGPKAKLSASTPMPFIRAFCIEHGIEEHDLGQSHSSQRWGLYNLLREANWPDERSAATLSSPRYFGVLAKIIRQRRLRKAGKPAKGRGIDTTYTPWLNVELPPPAPPPAPPPPSKAPAVKSPKARLTKAAKARLENLAKPVRPVTAHPPAPAPAPAPRPRAKSSPYAAPPAGWSAATLAEHEARVDEERRAAAEAEEAHVQAAEAGASEEATQPMVEGAAAKEPALDQHAATLVDAQQPEGQQSVQVESQAGSSTEPPPDHPPPGSPATQPTPAAPPPAAESPSSASRPEKKDRASRKSKEKIEEVAPPQPVVVDVGPFQYVELSAFAAACGVTTPAPAEKTGWLDVFTHIIEASEEAILLVDMRVQGLPIALANAAASTLTGYSREEMVGRNCRFLQGKKTSSAAIRAMTKAVGERRYAILNVLNFRQDASQFVNNLSLHPIDGESGDYRYSVGVLADSGSERLKTAEGKAAIAKMRAGMPTKVSVDVGAARASSPVKAAKVDEAPAGAMAEKEALHTTWRTTLVKLTRLIYSLDWKDTLTHLLTLEPARKAFHKWLLKHSAENVVMFEVTYEVDVRLGRCTSSKQAEKLTLELGAKYLLEDCPSEVEKARALLDEKSEIAASELADRCLPKFVQSKGCLPLIEQLLGAEKTGPPPPMPAGLLWDPNDSYRGDVARWLNTVMFLGLALPAMLSITDMAASGNPLIFVNDAFCRVSGYAREAALGRNCRFLQGPDTEVQSVAVIQAALTDVSDCVVKITNYRKSGEPFNMLLALRPVVDAEQTRRFCIGLHFEITPQRPLKQLVVKLGKLVKLFPSQAPLDPIR